MDTNETNASNDPNSHNTGKVCGWSKLKTLKTIKKFQTKVVGSLVIIIFPCSKSSNPLLISLPALSSSSDLSCRFSSILFSLASLVEKKSFLSSKICKSSSILPLNWLVEHHVNTVKFIHKENKFNLLYIYFARLSVRSSACIPIFKS